MLEWLLTIDRAVFLFINRTLANPVTDLIMPVVTNDNFLRLLYLILVVTLIIVGRKQFLWAIFFSIIVVVLTDQASASLLKPLFGRLRPCRIMDVHLLVGCGSGFSFPSSHAANLFAQALFWGLLYRRWLWPFIGFAFLVGLSRIFVGVHYPLDVLAGALMGASIGALAFWLLSRLKPHRQYHP